MNRMSTLAVAMAFAAACLAFSLAGCLGKKPAKKDDKSVDPWAAPTSDKKPASAKGEEADGDDDDQGTGLGGNWQMMLSTVSAKLSAPGPYDEPTESSGFSEGEPHLAVFELSGAITELESYSLFGGAEGVPLRDLTELLAGLAASPKVTGLLLRLGDASLSLPAAEELRAALLRFKGEGDSARPLHCFTERASIHEYYLLSACDRIGLAPTGEIVISGVAASPVHLKGLLDKLGVQPDFLHVGAFKGAAEPLTRDKPSKEMVQTLEAILAQQFATIVTGIAQGRKMDEARVTALIDTALFQHEDARNNGLVDEIATFEAFRASAAGSREWKKVKLGDSSAAGILKVMDFLGIGAGGKPSEPHVALVYAVGNVIDGPGDGMLGARQEIASRTLSAALRTMASDDKVKAVVLRIDSGGGSALASEIIWHAAREVASKKPLLVSMGAVAASGGYYIACGAAKIYANATTLTGSIGVVGGKLALGRALAKYGVTTHPVAIGKRALLYSAMQPWTSDERAAIQGMMEGVYKVFVERVAAGRKKTYDDIHAIAQGRVWTGAAALERGLVDEIGTVEDALADARARAGLAADSPLEVYPGRPTLRDFVGMLGEVQAPFGLATALDSLALELGPKLGAHVVAQLRTVFLLANSPVLAAAFLPLFE